MLHFKWFSRLLHQVRVGTSALFSALNALPWDEDEGADSSDSDDDLRATRGEKGAATNRPTRPKGKPEILNVNCSVTF